MLQDTIKKLLKLPMYKSSAKQNVGAAYWLRSVRALPDEWYAFGIIFDLVARLSWAVYISPGQTVVEANVTLLLGTIELLRRASWGLFRLEWEQIRRKSVQVHTANVQPLLKRDSAGRLLSAEEMIEAALQRNKQVLQEAPGEALAGTQLASSSGSSAGVECGAAERR